MCREVSPSDLSGYRFQFIENDLIALFGFEKNGGAIRIVQEKHYRLVPPDSFSLDDDLNTYHNRSTDHWII